MVYRKDKVFYFKDYPEFRPNLSPREIFKLGSFGGTYWRPIYSSITNKSYSVGEHKKFPAKWWKGIKESELTKDFKDYDISLNKYKVKVGTTLQFWEEKKWITETDPYGWIQWYCNFFNGRRTHDDERQIKRWKGIAGKNGRFRKYLLKLINDKKTTLDDYTVSPKIRQTLQHWAFKID